jgi:hypothetical protein
MVVQVEEWVHVIKIQVQERLGRVIMVGVVDLGIHQEMTVVRGVVEERELQVRMATIEKVDQVVME